MAKDIASWVALISAGLSALLGLYAAVGIDVRDNIDAFIGDIQRQSHWAAWVITAAP